MHTRIRQCAGIVLLFLGFTLIPLNPAHGVDSDLSTADDLLRYALTQARTAGSVEVHTDLTQHRGQDADRPDASIALRLRGRIGGPDRARFTLNIPAGATHQTDPIQQELLLLDNRFYTLQNGHWQRDDAMELPLGNEGGGLSLLEAATAVHFLPAPMDGPSLQRIGFALENRALLQTLLAAQGALTPQNLTQNRSFDISGNGELQINHAGLPVALALSLRWTEPQSGLPIHMESHSDFAHFGHAFPPTLFDPTLDPHSGALQPEQLHIKLMPPLAGLLAIIFALALCRYLLGAERRRVYVRMGVSTLLVVALLVPTVAAAADGVHGSLRNTDEAMTALANASKPRAAAAATEHSSSNAISQLMAESRALAEQYQWQKGEPLANLAASDDFDGDKLPNGYEVELGTNPFHHDSDRDGLSDFVEVVGYPCGSVKVETDPLNPDSNGDGLFDGAEYGDDKCDTNTDFFLTPPNPWNDDNDNDLVPDGLDLSPFSQSVTELGFKKAQGTGDAYSYWDRIPGPNFAFEMLDQDPSLAVKPYPYYVDIQVRPTQTSSLRYAYRKVTWPLDLAGPIWATKEWGQTMEALFQTDADLVSSGEVEFIPVLEATVRYADLPSPEAREQYAITAQLLDGHESQPQPDDLWLMRIPLLPVMRGGTVHAFQARIFHDHWQGGVNGQESGEALTQRWQDLRFKWVLLADLSFMGDDGIARTSPEGRYPLVIYDEPYRITGLQVERQGGAAMLVAGAEPGTILVGPNDPPLTSEDAATPIVLLRAGLEAQFLGGKINLADVYNRFDADQNALLAERWNIPPAQRFQVKTGTHMQYTHLDAAITDVNTAHARALLEELYPNGTAYQPTLLFASEQKRSVVNLDAYSDPDYSSELTINTCLNPLITSRSLKLQRYQYGTVNLPGAQVQQVNSIAAGGTSFWTPVALDALLQQLDATLPNFAVLENGELGPAASELLAAHNITKLATTAWYLGQTAIQRMGAVDVQDGSLAPEDLEVAAALLNESGVLPDEYTDAVFALLDVYAAGGPIEWLQQQWNQATGIFGDGGNVLGSFLDFAPEESNFDFNTLLDWTNTAINILNALALFTGDSFFSQVANVLTQFAAVAEQARQVFDAVKNAVDAAQAGIDVVNSPLFSQTSSFGGFLDFLGLLYNIGTIWLNISQQIHDLPPDLVALLIVQGLIDTLFLIVLFVVAATGAIGFAVAVAIGLVKAIEQWLDINLFVETFVTDLLFEVEVEGETWIAGEPEIGAITFDAKDPMAGVLRHQPIELDIAAETVIAGPQHLLTYAAEPYAQIRLGAHLAKTKRYFPGNTSGYWSFASTGKFFNDNLRPDPVGGTFGLYLLDSLSESTLTILPGTPQINGSFRADVSMKVRHVVQLDCIVCEETTGTYINYTDPVWTDPILFDIIPHKAGDFWQWDELTNSDPDGDDLSGYKPAPTENALGGPDANLCGDSFSHVKPDTDGDGLTDGFEQAHDSFSPCLVDSDNDGLDDGRELQLGTDPGLPDTDGDGLLDGEEVAVWSNGQLKVPWRVQIGAPGGVPLPAAFPNPRQANLDADHRNDAAERTKGSSPNSADPRDPDEFTIKLQGGVVGAINGNLIHFSSEPWPGGGPAARNAILDVTLPANAGGARIDIRVTPPIGEASLDQARPLGVNGTLHSFALPPLTVGRQVQAIISGLPTVEGVRAGGGDSVNVSLRYNDGAADRTARGTIRRTVATATAVLITSPRDGLVAGGGPVLFSGRATGNPAPTVVELCITSASSCSDGQWQQVRGSAAWQLAWTPPTDGTYHIYGRARNGFGRQSAVGVPVTFHVDSTPPATARFDATGTLYTQSAHTSDGPPLLTLTGRAEDAAGGYISGVTQVALHDDQGRIQTVAVDQPGARSGAFTAQLPLPGTATAIGSRAHTQLHTFTLAAGDVAGNGSLPQSMLQVLVDDTPPALHVALPQTSDTLQVTLAGRVDDHTHELGPRLPFANVSAATDAATTMALDTARAAAQIVPDLNGDTLDDLVIVRAATGRSPLQLGILFGKPDGLPANASLATADVRFSGAATGVVDFVAAIAGAGDVNGDGLHDLLVGDPSDGNGVAYLLLGRHNWPATLSTADANWQLQMRGASGFGATVAHLHDLNGDGLSDIAVGAASDGSANGVAWLYLGREQGTPTPFGPLQAPNCANCTAQALPVLAGPGDVNGDGLADLLFGYGADVHLVHGRSRAEWPTVGTALNSVSAARFRAAGPAATVATAADLNRDGLADFLIGDPGAATPRAFLLFGRRGETRWPAVEGIVDLVSGADRVVAGAAGSRLGASLYSTADLDGDQRPDFVLGASTADGGRGQLLLAQSSRLPATREIPSGDLAVITGNAGQQLGAQLTTGDINGDGVVDLLAVASGTTNALLFTGAAHDGPVAGVTTVEVGYFGPLVDASVPVSQTMPRAWQPMTVATPNAPRSIWRGALTLPGPGDYRIYARATDRAGNMSPDSTWYVGTVWAATNPAPVANGGLRLEDVIAGQNGSVGATVSTNGAAGLRMVRFYDGVAWHRLSLSASGWRQRSIIPRTDRRTLAVRAVARDAFGNSAQLLASPIVDSLVAAPVLTADLPTGGWQTDTTPTLNVSWPAPTDGSEIAAVFAAIDTEPASVPRTSVAGNRISRPLDRPGVYYGHVRVVDGAGNERTSHIGPFGVNGSRTPSVIHVDGRLDLARGEYPLGTLLAGDPFGLRGTTILRGAWDNDAIYLGFEDSSWGTEQRLLVYLDTVDGGLTTSLTPFGRSHTLPFAADYALEVGTSNRPGYLLHRVSGRSWEAITGIQSIVNVAAATEIALDRNEIGARGALKLVAYTEEVGGVSMVLPGSARSSTARLIAEPLTFQDALHWAGLGDGVRPDAAQQFTTAPQIRLDQRSIQRVLPGQELSFRVTISNTEPIAYTDQTLVIAADPKLALTTISGATCRNCTPGAQEWTLVTDLAPGAAQAIEIGARATADLLDGRHSVGVTASLVGSRGDLAPATVGLGRWYIDAITGHIGLYQDDDLRYAKPGPFQVPFALLGAIPSCLSQLEANTGNGWQALCTAGDCFAVNGVVAPGTTEWQLRVAGANGRTSAPRTVRIVADDSPPVPTLATSLVISQSTPFLRGSVIDNAAGAPIQVEVSVNGAPFAPALVGANTIVNAAGADPIPWIFPLHSRLLDGRTPEIRVRAIDSAGNVSAVVRPTTLTVDKAGPTVALTAVDENRVGGTVTDDGGIARVEVSLDGGITYVQVSVQNGQWSLDRSAAPGQTGTDFALVRASDGLGNVSETMIALAHTGASDQSIYLPIVLR